MGLFDKTFGTNDKIKVQLIDNFNGEIQGGIYLSSMAGDGFGGEVSLIEFQNGCFLMKGSMSPIGIGNADLFLFESKDKVEKRYDGEIKKVF